MPPDTIKALVESNKDSVIKRLPRYLSPEHFFQVCYALDRDPKVARVARNNPDSVLSAILQAADCGLVIGGPFQHCWVIPYGEVVNFQIGWRGFVYQWIHAGAVLKVVSQVVYEGDEIEVIAGDVEGINHKPNLTDPNRDDHKWLYDKEHIIGAYSIAWLPTGLKQYKWLPRGVIEAARARSQNSNGPAWRDNYPAMAAKTAVRRLDGLIQVCGPTPENREAWSRYTHTIEVDRKNFKIDPEPSDVDDLPGNSGGGTSPTADRDAPRQDRPTTTDRNQSSGPPPPPLKDDPPPEEDRTIISEDRQDALMELSRTADMTPSKFRKFVRETFQAELHELTVSQANQLTRTLQEKIQG